VDKNRQEKVRLWQERLELTFSGPNNIIGENTYLIDEQEKTNSLISNSKFRGYTVLMDSFFDFYLETLNNLNSRQPDKWNELVTVYTTNLVVAFWRLKASYNLFWQGYFFDATSLLRTIFEISMEISALYSKTIKLEDIFYKKHDQSLSEEEIRKSYANQSANTSKKVTDSIIGKDSGLSDETKKTFIIFKDLLHKSIHNSRLAFFSYYREWREGKRSLPILPTFDETHATLYTNYTAPICWMIVRALFLLQVEENEFSEEWQNKYKVMDESFLQVIDNIPNKDWRPAFPELIEKKFTFTIS
jgi:hypothetical protein